MKLQLYHKQWVWKEVSEQNMESRRDDSLQMDNKKGGIGEA